MGLGLPAPAPSPSIESLVPAPEWIPTEGTPCDVTVRDAPSNSYMEFGLISTNWPGFCMNAGLTEYGDKPDLTFAPPPGQVFSGQGATEPVGVPLRWKVNSDGNAIRVEWDNIAPTKFVLRVFCFDYGAIGKIYARLYAGPGPPATANCMIPKFSASTPYIASAQLQRPGWSGWLGAPGDDTETGPGSNGNPGDGLSAFEEYRGFLLGKGGVEKRGVHRRTSPQKKDIFVYSEFIDLGIGWAANPPTTDKGLPKTFKVWEVEPGQMEDFNPRPNQGNKIKTINFLGCADFRVLNQKALWVEAAGVKKGINPEEGHYGFTQFRGSTPQGPARVIYCRVYAGNIKKDIDDLPKGINYTRTYANYV